MASENKDSVERTGDSGQPKKIDYFSSEAREVYFEREKYLRQKPEWPQTWYDAKDFCELYKSACAELDAAQEQIKKLEESLNATYLKRDIQISELNEQLDAAIKVLKRTYRKHWLDDMSIGWNELGSELRDILCELIGDTEFQKLLNEVKDDNAEVS